MNIKELFKELSELTQVEAIALGGSRATGKGDEKSDYDVYLYVTEEVPNEIRKEILEKYCSEMEIGNHYWESEDNCVLNDGIDIDIIFAVNEMTHPGEKRLVQLCREQCKILPEHFEENLEKLFAEMFQGDVGKVIAELIEEIGKIAVIE